MKNNDSPRQPIRTLAWGILLVCVISWFFHECLFEGYSLVPTDLLYNLILPYCASVKHVHVQNHYALDALTTDYPWTVFWQQTVRAGELPLWNPSILGGSPHLADGMAAVFSPFKLLCLVLPAERAFSLGIVLEFLLAGLFMFALLREVKRSSPASFVGACAWALNSGFLMWYWRAPNLFCWAPLVLLLVERSVRRNGWGYALTAGLTLGVACLSGNIQADFHLGFLCAAYGAGMVIWHDPRSRRRTLARVVLILMVGVLVSAVQWLPTLELMAHDAYNSAQVRGPVMSWRHTLLGIPCLLTFVFPALTGSTETFDLLKVAGATRADFTGYIGVVPFALFVIGAGASRDWRVRGALWTLSAVLGIIFLTPLVKYTYHRFFVVAVFASAFVSAYGADALLGSPVKDTRRIRCALLGMAGLCVLVAAAVLAVQGVVAVWGNQLTLAAQKYVGAEAQEHPFSHRPEWFAERVRLFFEHYRITNVEFWLPLGIGICAAVLWAGCQHGRIPRRLLAAVLVALTILDLVVLGRRLMPQCDLQQFPLQPPTAVLKPLAGETDLFRAQRSNVAHILRPNWLMLYGIHDLSGNFSMAPETLEILTTSTNNQYTALFDLANVEYLITEDSLNLPPERFTLVTEVDGLRLYRNPHCLPRLQFYGQWQVVPDRGRMLALMKADSFRPQETVFLEETPTLAPSPSKASATIKVERYTANRVVVRVNATRSGILLIADTWYPGWKATVDGHTAPLYRADHALRATEVPEGEHVVQFRFAPTSIAIGAAISLATSAFALLLVLAGCFRGLRQRT